MKTFSEIDEILEKIRRIPYKIYPVKTPHTGYIRSFEVKNGSRVNGPSGKWKEKPGTPLFVLERERNLKVIRAKIEGEVVNLREELLNRFVEADEVILEIKHSYSLEEIISQVLLKALYIIKAPETARYFLAPEFSKKLEKMEKFPVRKGEEVLIMTFMKRETPIYFDKEGDFIFYKIFFKHGELVEEGKPLLGFCEKEKLPYLQKILSKIKKEFS